MTIGETQRLFVQLISKLIEYAYQQGWAFTFGESFRIDGKGHMPNSLHYERLAVDMNLFVNNVYITGDDPVWHLLGDFWKSLHPLCRWGGDIVKKMDYNHFSMVSSVSDNRI